MEEMKIVMLPVGMIWQHPKNPRKALGDLTELTDSIRQNGIRQNLTVIRGHWKTAEEKAAEVERRRAALDRDDYDPDVEDFSKEGYTAIIGHRRLAAAKMAGLQAVPCVITEMSEKDQQATMLLENIQRTDLTLYEQAQGFQMMMDLGSSVEEISEKTGFGKTTVRKRLKMMELDQDKLAEVVKDRQISLSDFEKLGKIEDIETRNQVLMSIGTSNFEMNVSREIRMEKRAKNEPIIRAMVEEQGAMLMSDRDQYSGKYDVVHGSQLNVDDWDGERITIPEGKVWYVLEYGMLRLYRKAEKAKPVRKSDEEIREARRITSVWAEVDELTRITAEKRENFVKFQMVTKDNIGAYLKGAVLASVIPQLMYTGAMDDLKKMLDIQSKGSISEMATEATEKILNGNIMPKVPQLILTAMKQKRIYCSSYRNMWPKHEKDTTLDAIYKWLESIGYQMSEEEMQLKDGTHRIFNEEAWTE